MKYQKRSTRSNPVDINGDGLSGGEGCRPCCESIAKPRNHPQKDQRQIVEEIF
jgi:hypothetical protein